MIYVILGAPGSGKGTRAGILEEKLGLIHISTGSMIREDKEVYEKYKEEIHKGHLLSDDIINGLLQDRLNNSDIDKGFIIDGYPRTIEQAHKLDEILSSSGKKIEKVFLLEADTETVYSRILSRTICPQCGETYNKKYAEENNNKCGKCGKELVLRTDDNNETLKNRIAVYYNSIEEIKEYYSKKGILEIVDALEEPNKMLERI